MPLDMHYDADTLDIAEMYGDADEAMPGWDRYALERDLGDYLSKLRVRERQREFLNTVLAPFGWSIRALPNWRYKGGFAQ